jgi:hypothetical protein
MLECFRIPAMSEAVAQWSLTNLREKLVKNAAKAVRHARDAIFQVAGGYGAERTVRSNTAADRLASTELTEFLDQANREIEDAPSRRQSRKI